MPHLFTYGSLMFNPVWSSIVSGNYHSEKARINGYKRVRLEGETYPALLVCSDSRSIVEGIIYYRVSAEDMVLLDQFEGSSYIREMVDVALEAPDQLRAETYLWRNSSDEKLSDELWDVEEFKQHGLAQFLRSYVGFNQ